MKIIKKRFLNEEWEQQKGIYFREKGRNQVMKNIAFTVLRV